MAKRYRDNLIWDEDWFIILPPLYKLLWEFINDKCDHAGIWKPNLALFIRFNGEVDLDKSLEFFNDEEKARLIKLENGKFFIPGFFVFQYGHEMNLNNKVHLSVFQIYKSNGVSMDLVRGLEALKDMDKEKDKDKKKINKVSKINNPPTQEKIELAPFVQMTDEEYSKLRQEYGEELTKLCIEKLDNYKASSGKKYKDDYRAILSWVVEDVKKKNKQVVAVKGEKLGKAESLMEMDRILKQMHDNE